MLYLLFTANCFEKSRLEEIKKLTKFRIVTSFNNILIIDAADKNLAKALSLSNSAFLYSAHPLFSRIKIDERDYLISIYGALSKIQIPKDKKMKVECLDINSKRGYTAKDIEVYTGQRLEREGFSIDIHKPEVLVYLILADMNCYAGLTECSETGRMFLNPLRYYAKAPLGISRSELKLREAFDEFHIRGNGKAIDLGAAPGGWSGFLVKSGFRVIAVDRGDLDYKKLCESGVKAKTFTKANAEIWRYLDDYDIIHIKGDSKKIDLNCLSGVDLLVNDMNTSPSDSADMVLLHTRSLKPGARLIMTVKCPTRNVGRYVPETIEILSRKFETKAVKALPSNRQEVTLYAEYKRNQRE